MTKSKISFRQKKEKTKKSKEKTERTEQRKTLLSDNISMFPYNIALNSQSMVYEQPFGSEFSNIDDQQFSRDRTQAQQEYSQPW